jgi:capsule biosynthesis phosphatase
MNIINSFLEKLHTDESMFPMDNYATDKSEDDEEIVSEQKKNSDKKRIMIDLDGTIHKYSKGWNGGEIYDPPFEGSIDAIKWLKNQGFEIMIFTTRASKANCEEMGGDYLDQIKKVKEWLDEYNIPYDGITAEKIAAEFYIDDKAIHIPNGNWDFVVQTIQKRMSV